MLAPRRRRHSLLPFAILACGALLPAVQARADAGLLDLPLEDLLAVEVRAAGKRDEQIRDIPASVTILNRAEIQRYGWATFEELLRNLPGLFILDTIDERLTGARGTVGGGIQLLVNGVPQHQTRQKGLTITEVAQVNIPVESIDRIEVIRGPMSVIYGNNAFLGVINVVTNEVGRNGPRVSASYGSRDSGRLFARLGTETDSGFVVLNAGAYRTDGLDGAYADMLGPDQLATLDPRMHRSLDGDVPKQDLSLDLSAAYGDFSADLRWTQTDYGVYIFTPSFDDGNQATITTWHAALGWEHAFSDTLGMRASGIASEERLDIDRFDFIAPDLGGEQHQDNRRWELERVLPRVRQLTSAPVLVRIDGAHDSAVNRRQLAAATGVDYLIKWNPRHEDPETWLAKATARGAWEQIRDGKRQALFSVDRSDEHDGEQHRWRLVVRLIERTIDRKGQLLLTPEIELEGWSTSLPESDYDNSTILKLYRGHALCEQFHSEFKTDLDLERLPSGKFDTNDLVMTFGALAYNILRWMGLRGLMGKHAPIRHPAKRRRLRTVMQELIYPAARVVRSARQLTLRFSHHCPGFEAFRKPHAEFP